LDILETIKDKELGSQIRFRSLVRSAPCLREDATSAQACGGHTFHAR